MRRRSFACALAVFAASGLARAQTASPKSEYLQSCNSWLYATSANGYVCSSPGFGVQVPSMYELQQLQQTVDQQRQQIADLESRVERLEQSLTTK